MEAAKTVNEMAGKYGVHRTQIGQVIEEIKLEIFSEIHIPLNSPHCFRFYRWNL